MPTADAYVSMECSVCHRPRLLKSKTVRDPLFTNICHSCQARATASEAAKKRWAKVPTRKHRKQLVDAVCPHCGKLRQVTRATRDQYPFTGLCVPCGRKQIKKKHKTRMKWTRPCLNCDTIFTDYRGLFMCKACRDRNADTPEDNSMFPGAAVRYGFPATVGVSDWVMG